MLYNVDDTTNKAGMITHYINLDVYTNKIHKAMHFLITDIGKEDILFRYPWLAAFHPEFDWRGGRIYNQYLPIELHSINPCCPLEPTIAALCIETNTRSSHNLNRNAASAHWLLILPLKPPQARKRSTCATNTNSTPPSLAKKNHNTSPQEEVGTTPTTSNWGHLTLLIATSILLPRKHIELVFV